MLTVSGTTDVRKGKPHQVYVNATELDYQAAVEDENAASSRGLFTFNALLNQLSLANYILSSKWGSEQLEPCLSTGKPRFVYLLINYHTGR